MASMVNITSLLVYQNLRLPEYQEKITSCAGKLMTRYSEVQSSIVYENVGKLADDILGNEMANTTRIINIKKYLKYSKNELEPYWMLTIIIQSINELEKYFDAVYRILGWNSRAKHFIIYIGDEDIDRIFELSWEKFIIKLIVLDRQQDLYTYAPLENGTCGKVVKKRRLFNCDDINYEPIDVLYASNGIVNFQGCEVRVLTFPLVPYVIDVENRKKPGFEIIVLKELAKVANFTIKFVKNNYTYWGHKTLENNYTEMYGSLFNREADIMLGMLVANGSFLYDFDSSISHAKSDLAFYVPAAQRGHPWENPIKVYTKIIWAIIGIVIILISILWYVIGRVQKNHERFNSFLNCATYVWAITLAESMTQPRTPTFRYIFIILSLYSLVLTSTFESSLMSFLTKPTYQSQINSIGELVDADLEIGGFEYARGLFRVDNEDNKDVYDNWVVCPLNEVCVNRTAEDRDFAALNDVRQINYLTKEYYISHDGTYKIHQMPVTSSFYMWIMLIKGFPIRNTMNRLIQRFIEFGFMEKWIKDVSYAEVPPDPIGHIALSLEHVVFPLVILVVGHFIAFIVFIGEIVYYKIRADKSKTN